MSNRISQGARKVVGLGTAWVRDSRDFDVCQAGVAKRLLIDIRELTPAIAARTAEIEAEPDLHRRGLGSALLREALNRCDQEHKPTYLESSNPANTALYQRHGFVALGVIRAAQSPPMVPMMRDAR